MVSGGVGWCGEVCCGVVSGVVWCGVVLYCVVWCGVVWCGVVWCCVVMCGGVFGVVRCGFHRSSVRRQWVVPVVVFCAQVVEVENSIVRNVRGRIYMNGSGQA
jgi:hypothetical protein